MSATQEKEFKRLLFSLTTEVCGVCHRSGVAPMPRIEHKEMSPDSTVAQSSVYCDSCHRAVVEECLTVGLDWMESMWDPVDL